MTLLKQDPSAQRPCAKTMLGLPGMGHLQAEMVARSRAVASTPTPPRTLRATQGVYVEIATGSRVAHLVARALSPLLRRPQASAPPPGSRGVSFDRVLGGGFSSSPQPT